MAGNGVSTPAVAAAGVGAVLIYSAVKGVSVVSGLRSVLSGHAPQGDQTQTLVPPDSIGAASPAEANSGSGGGAGSALAAAAAGYMGSGSRYRWGGGNPNGWDCSGFVNWVACHDLGYAIPGYAGGRFTGRSHGPVTGQWAIWGGAARIPASNIQPGDLIIWPTVHMGIAASATAMIGCPGPNGTPAPVMQTIAATRRGMPFVVRRLYTPVDLTGIS
jgi:NlpC/P60 family